VLDLKVVPISNTQAHYIRNSACI